MNYRDINYPFTALIFGPGWKNSVLYMPTIPFCWNHNFFSKNPFPSHDEIQFLYKLEREYQAMDITEQQLLLSNGHKGTFIKGEATLCEDK